MRIAQKIEGPFENRENIRVITSLPAIERRRGPRVWTTHHTEATVPCASASVY